TTRTGGFVASWLGTYWYIETYLGTLPLAQPVIGPVSVAARADEDASNPQATAAAMLPRARTEERGGRTLGRRRDMDGSSERPSLGGQREQTGLPGEQVVRGRRGAVPLVEQLQIARVDRLRLVGIAAHEIAVADVVRPSVAAEGDVGFAGEGAAL